MAASIADGIPVDWDCAEDSDPETTEVMNQLRKIETLARLSDPLPCQWGPFIIRSEIGRGSFGTVYRAFHPQLAIDVALKVIRPRPLEVSIDPSQALTEARLLAQINHPNVVRVYSADCLEQEVGVAMELVTGRTLQDVVRIQGPLSPRDTMRIGIDVCRALAAVHGAGVLHGDIKANNVMRAHDGRTVLMDFGAGHDLKTGLRSRSGAGTPLYLAPEIFAGSRRTIASDIYSLGVLLHYLSTGAYPVSGSSRTEIEERHAAHVPRRPLRELRSDLPEPFINVVDRCTAESPTYRFWSAAELEAALHKAMASTQGTSFPFFSRRTLTAAASFLAVLGLFAWLSTAGRAPTADAPAVRTTVASPLPATPATDSYEIEAAFYRQRNGQAVRLQNGARVAPGDHLSLQVTGSVPLYVYVVNEDDRGAAFLLFPLRDDQAAAPLSSGQRHEFPGVVNGERTFWQITTAGGREHFVIFASPEPPSPAFARMFAELPRPSKDAAVAPQPPSAELAGPLRGVGGLSPAPSAAPRLTLTKEMSTPLPETAETTRGVWVRQLTLDNP
jgi:eukaryotic-like serine/threonine-protein kinase